MTAVEYLILTVLLVAVAIAIWKTLGEPPPAEEAPEQRASGVAQAGAGAASRRVRSMA